MLHWPRLSKPIWVTQIEFTNSPSKFEGKSVWISCQMHAVFCKAIIWVKSFETVHTDRQYRNLRFCRKCVSHRMTHTCFGEDAGVPLTIGRPIGCYVIYVICVIRRLWNIQPEKVNLPLRPLFSDSSDSEVQTLPLRLSSRLVYTNSVLVALSPLTTSESVEPVCELETDSTSTDLHCPTLRTACRVQPVIQFFCLFLKNR